ncbi:uncharacterized protein LOC102807725, partial [Saccoglossus kowalevskii]|uniref:Uncharacterized protein LOC102807725 n=1 Tax=Saccoglossus kowalevskii TaxID=10224 RepID=A0ABM0N1J0_SACKO
MQIVFSCQKESAKFNVSTAHGAVEPKTPEDWGCLITGETFESKAAKEFIKPPTLKKKDKDKKQLRFRPVNKNKSRERDLAELQKILEFPDKNEYEIPAEKELSRLQLKIKNITEDWMEHYRIAVGISSPHLRTISSAPRYRKARNIQSAKSVPGTMPSAKDFPQRPYTSSPLPEPRVKVRAPSAPPTTGFHNSRPFSSLSSPSRPVSRTSEKRKDHVRIEIDGVQAETSKSGTPNTLSVASGSPVHGSPVHSAIRSHSCNRTLRATSTTAEHKPTIVQRGCPVYPF